MKRGGPLRRRTRLRPVSEKRLREKPARAALRDVIERRDGTTCYAAAVINHRRATAVARGWPLNCWHPSGPLDMHEVVPRSVWKGGHLVASNVRLVCRRHHEWIDAHEIDAATLGLHGYSWERGRCPNEGCGELLGRCRCEAT